MVDRARGAAQQDPALVVGAAPHIGDFQQIDLAGAGWLRVDPIASGRVQEAVLDVERLHALAGRRRDDHVGTAPGRVHGAQRHITGLADVAARNRLVVRRLAMQVAAVEHHISRNVLDIDVEVRVVGAHQVADVRGLRGRASNAQAVVAVGQDHLVDHRVVRSHQVDQVTRGLGDRTQDLNPVQGKATIELPTGDRDPQNVAGRERPLDRRSSKRAGDLDRAGDGQHAAGFVLAIQAHLCARGLTEVYAALQGQLVIRIAAGSAEHHRSGVYPAHTGIAHAHPGIGPKTARGGRRHTGRHHLGESPAPGVEVAVTAAISGPQQHLVVCSQSRAEVEVGALLVDRLLEVRCAVRASSQFLKCHGFTLFSDPTSISGARFFHI